MRKGHSFIYFGEDVGKTTQAIGQSICAIDQGLTVILIRFLNFDDDSRFSILRNFEPDLKIFRFEKERCETKLADEAERKEIKSEILNGFNFSNKILETGECDMLILDGILDAVKEGFLHEDELLELLGKKSSNMDLIITGKQCSPAMLQAADGVYEISALKEFLQD